MKVKNKFKMELVWHNCYSHPPKEYWNNKLYVTNGEYIHEVEYYKERGWWSRELGDYIPFNELSHYWWADLEQTVNKCLEFTKENENGNK